MPAGYLTDKFKKDTECLRKIGSSYGSQKEFAFVVVTGLVYSQCKMYSNWLVAKARHSYFTTDSKRICQQDSGSLFAIEMGIGKTSTNTIGC